MPLHRRLIPDAVFQTGYGTYNVPAGVREFRDGLRRYPFLHTQDPRSFMLDGEEVCIVAGEGALLAAGDMLLLSTAGVTWLHGVHDLELHLPPKGAGFTEAARAAEAIF